MDSATPNMSYFLVCCTFLLFATIQLVQCSNRSFTVDYENHTFLKDGLPFNYVAGSIHYSRVPHYYWRDRLQKMYAGGLDAIQVYVPWNVHEPQPGQYDFIGQQDVLRFIEIAQEENLLIILRAGPYICGEWEFGGFPAWLLTDNSSVVLRSSDPGYLKHVDKWFGTFLPMLRPALYSAGGNIIMVQVENEYGSFFTCDFDYMDHLAEEARRLLGDDIILFTTDGAGAGYLKCGANKHLLTTIDFGQVGNVTKAFAPLVNHKQGGPLVNSEYYTGWLDHWHGNHQHRGTDAIVRTLKDMLDLKASVNMYMYEGGTNFGYTSGADPVYTICPTSYDYDSPLTEAGDITDKYMAIRELIGKYKSLPDVPVPPSLPKYAYGDVVLSMTGRVLDLLPDIGVNVIKSKYPINMEKTGHYYGFILYETIVAADSSGGKLDLAGVQDMGYVMIDGDMVGLIDRNGITAMNLVAAKGQRLSILVENQGRINFGKQILKNTKGIISNVTLNGQILVDWTMTSLDFQNATKTHSVHSRVPSSGRHAPAVYSGTFTLPNKFVQPVDTYLDPTGWFKGVAFVNGFNLGRYWPVAGPQVTLYVPAGVLYPAPQQNTITLLELQHAPTNMKITFTDTPYLNKTTHGMHDDTTLRFRSQSTSTYSGHTLINFD